ncbi:hypothetical protein Hdeb2414_s0010g00342151 [Helianthus debilis subsp. tardiflorus]
MVKHSAELLAMVQGMHADGALLSRLCIWNEALCIVNEEGVRAFWKGNMGGILCLIGTVVGNEYKSLYNLRLWSLSSFCIVKLGWYHL